MQPLVERLALFVLRLFRRAGGRYRLCIRCLVLKRLVDGLRQGLLLRLLLLLLLRSGILRCGRFRLIGGCVLAGVIVCGLRRLSLLFIGLIILGLAAVLAGLIPRFLLR